VAPVLSARRNMGKSHASRELALRTNPGVWRFVCNSEAVRREAVRGEGIDARLAVLLYNGIDLGPAEPEGWRAREGVPQAAPLVACVSRLYPVKGVDSFVEAFARVAEQVPEAHAVLVGDGPERARLAQRVAARGLAGRIHFAGDRPQVRPLLAECQLAVLASRSEGFSNALVEYMAAGLPSVATRVGGNAEAVRDGQDGLLVEPGDPDALADAMVRLLRDESLRRTMGRSAAQRARQLFDREGMLDGMARILEEAISTCPR